MSAQLTEEYMVENHAVNVFKNLNYEYIHGSKLTPDTKKRESYRDVILKNRFINAIRRLNPWLNEDMVEKVYQLVSNIDHPDPVTRGKMFYDMLTSGVKLTFKENGEECNFLKLFPAIEPPPTITQNSLRWELSQKSLIGSLQLI